MANEERAHNERELHIIRIQFEHMTKVLADIHQRLNKIEQELFGRQQRP